MAFTMCLASQIALEQLMENIFASAVQEKAEAYIITTSVFIRSYYKPWQITRRTLFASTLVDLGGNRMVEPFHPLHCGTNWSKGHTMCHQVRHYLVQQVHPGSTVHPCCGRYLSTDRWMAAPHHAWVFWETSEGI